jgi:hypothetical protein
MALVQAARRRRRHRGRHRGRGRGFKPFHAPIAPPPNTYDPALDSQLRASQRGLGDLQMDTERTGSRNLSDYLLARGNMLRQQSEGLGDINRNVQALGTRYGQLGHQQQLAAAAAGVAQADPQQGALLAAAQKRARNYTLDRQPLDLQKTRLQQATARGLGELGVNYQRSVEDSQTALTRARREGTFFGQDVSQQRFYQARAGGYVPPTAPGNEFHRHGLTYRVGGFHGPAGRRTYELPGGQRFGRSAWLRYLRRRRR